MRYRISFFILFVFLTSSKVMSQAKVEITVLRYQANYDSKEPADDEYTIKFYVEGNPTANPDKQCQTFDGQPGSIRQSQHQYYRPVDVHKNTVQLKMEAWEDDDGDRCDLNGGDDGHCPNDINDFDFISNSIHNTSYYGGWVYFCDRKYAVEFNYRWSPPLLTNYNLTGTFCSTKDVIPLKVDPIPSYISSKVTVRYRWEYFDGNSWRFAAESADEYYYFVAPYVTVLSKIKFRVAPVIKGYTAEYTESSDAVDVYPPPPTGVEFKVNNILCRDAKNGSVEVGNVTGTYPTYYIALRNKANDATFPIFNHPKTGTTNYIIGLDEGNYELKVLNNIWQNDTIKQICSYRQDITIIQPATKIQYNVPANTNSDYNGYNISCFNGTNGSISVSSSGGTGSHTYSLDNINYQPSVQFSNLKAGTYTLYIKDQNGCTPAVNVSTTLTQPTQLRVIPNPTEYYRDIHIKCNGNTDGKIELTQRGGVSPYSSSINYDAFVAGRTTFDNLAAGKYNLRGQDRNGCIASTDVSLSQPLPLIVDKNTTSPTCNGFSNGLLTFALRGGTTYGGNDYRTKIIYPDGSIVNKDGNVVSLNGIKAGSYVYDGTDGLGCLNNGTVLITEPDPLTANITYTDVACKGDATGSVVAIPKGGTTPYSLNFLDANTNLPGGTLTRQGNNFLIGRLPKGNYKLELTDNQGCKPLISYTQKIAEPDLPLKLTTDEITQVKCFSESNGQIKLRANGGWGTYTYSVDNKAYNNNPTILGLSAGSYKLLLKDRLSCKDSILVQITQPRLLVSTIKSQENIKCFGGQDGSIHLRSSGGTQPYQYAKEINGAYQSDSIFGNLKKGNYILHIKDQNGCVDTAKALLTEPSDLQVSVVAITNAACNKPNGSAVVKATGGVGRYNYSWNYNRSLKDSSVTNVYSGKYYAIAEDRNKCKDSIAVSINDEDGPLVRQGTVKGTTCSYLNNGSASVNVAGGHGPFKYYWPASANSSSTPVAANLLGGQYLVEVIDAKDCKGSVVVVVPSPDTLRVKVDSLINPICANQCNGKIAVGGSGGTFPYSYGWDNNELKGNVIDKLCEGSYIVTLADKNSCISKDTLILKDPVLSLSIGDSAVICKGQVLNLDAGIEDVEYSWSSDNGFKSSEQKVRLTAAGLYTVRVVNKSSCVITDTFKVITSTKLLQAKFLLSSKAIANDTINIVEYSWPTPETIQWTFPKEFQFVREDQDWQYWKLPEPGTYTVKLTVMLGECKDELEKEIVVLSPFYKDSLENSRLGFSGIENIVLFPNPNTGSFALNVKLTDAMDMDVEVYSLYGRQPLYKTRRNGQSVYNMNLELLNLPAGAYFVSVKTGSDYKMLKFLIN